MRRVCIYHAGCPDGFGAAWAAWQAWGEDALYVARGHDDDLRAGDYAGDFVLFADIAPPAHAPADLAEQAGRLVVLDHHVSARERYLADPSLAEHVASTGLGQDKFGVPHEHAAALYRKARALPGVRVTGIDCHIGSQLTETGPSLPRSSACSHWPMRCAPKASHSSISTSASAWASAIRWKSGRPRSASMSAPCSRDWAIAAYA